MRVISQDGTMDVPYERFIFYIAADNSIIATRNFGGDPDDIFSGRIAEYSSRGKASKVMEMMKNKYSEYLSTDGGALATVNFYVQPNVWNIPKVFQLPQDDEIEEDKKND